MAADHALKNTADALAKVYAQALLDLAVAAGQVDEVAEQIGQLGELAETDAPLRALLASRLLSVQKRAGIMERIFKGNVNDLVYRFLSVLNRRNRLERLSVVAGVFGQLVDERRGVEHVDAFVAVAMNDAESQGLAKAIGAALGKQVVLRQAVDRTLIGGLKLRVKDQLLDGSVAARLKRMRRELMDAGREQARTNMGRLLDGEVR
ncbi:MAG: ATP synthase F1 subunit delta [Phycisphaeraceae bacterium]|nr:ATP synthase F1 subunit delta [Phycisphaeraceae bacterium]